MDMLMPVDMAGSASKIALECVELAIQFRIDFSPIQPIGERLPHQHAKRRQPVRRRRVPHRAEGPVVGQGQMKSDIDLVGVGLQPGCMVPPEWRHRHATGGRQPAPVDQVADGRTDARREAVVVGAENERRRSGTGGGTHGWGLTVRLPVRSSSIGACPVNRVRIRFIRPSGFRDDRSKVLEGMQMRRGLGWATGGRFAITRLA